MSCLVLLLFKDDTVSIAITPGHRCCPVKWAVSATRKEFEVGLEEVWVIIIIIIMFFEDYQRRTQREDGDSLGLVG